MKPLGSIPIGNIYKFEHVVGNGSYAVYRKIYQDGRLSYVIARVPSIKAYTEPPSNVLEEFPDQASALETFMRWVQDPLVTQPLSPRKRCHTHDPGQSEFDLGRLQTKAEVPGSASRSAEKTQTPQAGHKTIGAFTPKMTYEKI